MAKNIPTRPASSAPHNRHDHRQRMQLRAVADEARVDEEMPPRASFWNWRRATFSTEACPIACRCARRPAAPAAAVNSHFAAVTRDDAFLLFELVLLGGAFVSFIQPILPVTGAAPSREGSPSAAVPTALPCPPDLA